MSDEAKKAAEEIEGHRMRIRGANEPGPDPENEDAQTRGPYRRENEEAPSDAEAVEGHMPYRRANEPGPDVENADPQAPEGNRRPRGDEDEEPETEAHRMSR